MKKYLLILSASGLLVIGFTGFIKNLKSDSFIQKEILSHSSPSGLNLSKQVSSSEYEKNTLEKADAAQRAQILQNISQLPLIFEKNMGQWRSEILYRASTSNAKVLFKKDGLSFCSLREREEHDEDDEEEEDGGEEEHEIIEKLTWNLNFKGMNQGAMISTEGEAPGVINYLIGNDSAKWIRNTPQSKLIKYQEIYEHIDLHYYGLAKRKLEYDYIIKPGGKISSIQMQLHGAGKLAINHKGELIISTPWGKVAEDKPFSYQTINGLKKEIDIRYYLLNDSTFGFKAYGEYDHSHDLTIDPKQLVWSTFSNGDNPTNYVYDIDIDGNKNSYVTGYTDGQFDITPGVVQQTFGGGSGSPPLDAFVCKFNRWGTQLLYCTYLGGDGEDKGFGIAASAGGNAYITGKTTSTNFPTSNAIYPALRGGADIFITALNPTGTAFIYSTYFGGGGNDEGRGIVVNSAGEVHVTGFGRGHSTPFPTTAGVYRTSAVAGTTSDAFVVKLTATGANSFCTLLGGGGTDEGRALFVSGTGEIYVTGETNNNTFPVTAGSYRTTYTGGTDVFVTKLNANATALVYSTYFGGSGSSADCGEGIWVRNDEAYVSGRAGNGIPTTAGAYQTAHGGGTHDNFVVKFNTAGSGLVYCTYLGGSATESQNDATRESDIVVNSKGEAYVSGITLSNDFPVVNGYDVNYNTGDDGYIVQLSADGSNILCSTYIGGTSNDYKRFTLALDRSGTQDTLYATITTHSTDFPIANTQGAVYSNVHTNSGQDEVAVLKMYGCKVPVLPVELISFTASNQGEHNLLQWATAQEINNDYFSIERSTDGENFAVIATIDGAGNSNLRKNYSYSDPKSANDITYYRLKQTDTDGTFTYSEIVVIHSQEKSKSLSLTISSPVNDKLYYTICCLQKGSAKVEIIDLSGKIIMSTDVEVHAGNNKLMLDIKNLAEGLYILQFTSADGTTKNKFIK